MHSQSLLARAALALFLIANSCSVVLAQGGDPTKTKDRMLRGHKHTIFGLAFMPDSKVLASGSEDDTIRLWDVKSGECFATIQTGADQVRGLAFSPKGEILAAAHKDGTVTLWDMNSLQLQRTLEGHTSEVYTVSFSPDGKTLASGGFDKTVRLWNVATGKLTKTLEGHTSWVWTVSFSKDGKRLASSGGMDRTARLWNVETGKVEKVFQPHGDKVRFVGILQKSGKVVTTSDDKWTRVWEIDSGKIAMKVQGYGGMLSGAVSPDETLIAASGGGRRVQVYDVKTGKQIAGMPGHRLAVWSLAFSPDGKWLASGGVDRAVLLWHLPDHLPQQAKPAADAPTAP